MQFFQRCDFKATAEVAGLNSHLFRNRSVSNQSKQTFTAVFLNPPYTNSPGMSYKHLHEVLPKV